MKKDNSDSLTPMMKQYQEIKSRNPEHILFYRLGDFYEMFFDDAKTASKVLNLTLTTRGKHLGIEIPLAGFPHHQINNYLSKMIRAGYKVAVCDQAENPKYAKGIVKREITDIVTAGTALSDEMIRGDSNNYIVCVFTDEKHGTGFAAADISTGEFTAYSPETAAELKETVSLFDPSEILIPSTWSEIVFDDKRTLTKIEDYKFCGTAASEKLKEYFKISSVSSLGFTDDEPAVICAGVLLEYLSENLKSGFSHLEKPKKYSDKNICAIDYRTRKNLEILEPVNSDGDKNATLYGVMNRTKTPMGARLLRKWLTMPLRDKEEINKRLEITEKLLLETARRRKITSILSDMADIERLSGKISAKKIRPDELLRLKNSLNLLPEIAEQLKGTGSEFIDGLISDLAPDEGIISLIDNSINEPEGIGIKEKRFIKKGRSKELDELYDIMDNGKDKILALSDTIKSELNIPTLRTGYNKVFGYYFEVTKKYSEMIPAGFIRKQTLVNTERFINQELKEFEEKILNADEKIEELEKEVYAGVLKEAEKHIESIKRNSAVIARLDCLNSFAASAEAEGYIRPVFTDKNEIIIKNGRHPVVEKMLKHGQDFIPNDLTVTEDRNLLIITGPNMSGKSTFLRQTALIVIMAQAGSFVPADNAVIGMTDRIFTRVGASDNLSGGESTFLVEMNETANILNNATKDSLIIFDEVGRGTATFDGLSLAWAILEYIHDEPRLMSRTLFATHYHELTDIERICPRAKNFHASVREHKDEVIFMRKIIEGGADNSYGIYVAKLAGIPEKVLSRAKVILGNLEENELTPDSKPVIAKDRDKKIVADQLSLFIFDNDGLRERLRETDLNNITPLQAFDKLKELKEMI
ncbi:MAG TPA: DNA mismatch repair protein MutS [Clostridiales bacterium]|nr:DNA mismatch repair protein MutS [Clostridiales bacterium]HQP69304.1 DNA mismatch repair protein MutS [Clostridiales bacterium]